MGAKKKKEKMYFICSSSAFDEINTRLNEINRIFYTMRYEIDSLREYIKTGAEENKERE